MYLSVIASCGILISDIASLATYTASRYYFLLSLLSFLHPAYSTRTFCSMANSYESAYFYQTMLFTWLNRVCRITVELLALLFRSSRTYLPMSFSAEIPAQPA